MHSNKYIFIYSVVMVLIVAVALTVVAIQLKPAQENNIRIEKMQNILTSVNIVTTPKDAETIYKKVIISNLVTDSKGTEISGVDAFSVDLAAEMKKPEADRKYPVYLARLDNGDTCFVFQLRGKGLWGPIWGYISLRSDMNSISGVMFDHKSETPGLGAEISTPAFMGQFKEKQIFDAQGNFTSVQVMKGGAPEGDVHAVDAISGGTITSKGVEHMIHDCLLGYEAFIKKHNSTKP
ncbi:MAG TPA: NADH:ubiquinone reductase (Na(+)-transporting) subunit C [Bacteroidales bacterium]|nr:MAG: NADH:ubiquinone reductase (Na(+)-transporting) subunit C [Bacteroidetes bacterium GWE2_42_24]OFY31661.1 MAG: NADH:ubiquinone reductase (Na(+)-transporting) subunit C [Bacteroidetes bacterium GWF2_43_11]HAQ64471.1 NADH:ubiquinone reductase (Na(+)-transporting) subunit C [Bacteroidales bacterium]HBZ67076.1 NADH:ubiquinone reductase (Na(+)-transporting) subunit C [Bacteroidales bacterium]